MTTETVQRQQEVTYLEAISQALDEEIVVQGREARSSRAG